MRIYSPEVLAKLEQAQAAKSAAEAQSQKAQAGARKEQKEGAYEMWQKAKAGLEVAEKSFERVERLYKEGVLPAQKYDELPLSSTRCALPSVLLAASMTWQ